MNKEKLEKLATEKNDPCITISMNTNRTFPANQNDIIVLKNLLEEATERVIKEFGKRPESDLLEKLAHIESEIDVNYNLDSLHIFLSNATQEIIRSAWPTASNMVHVSERFAVKPLIKMFNRTEEYLILMLSQSDARLLMAVNDGVVGEINNEDFPFVNEDSEQADTEDISDTKQTKNKTREFFNKIDKAVVRAHNKTDMNCVVISTSDNYNRFVQIADKPSVYIGWTNLSQDTKGKTSVAKDAWQIVRVLQEKVRAENIHEMQEAVGSGMVITELSEIYRTAKEGRGDLLIVNDEFHQAVRVTDEFALDLVTEATLPGVIDDITSEIAWEVISKKGRVQFTTLDELKAFGNIAMKERY